MSHSLGQDGYSVPNGEIWTVVGFQTLGEGDSEFLGVSRNSLKTPVEGLRVDTDKPLEPDTVSPCLLHPIVCVVIGGLNKGVCPTLV